MPIDISAVRIQNLLINLYGHEAGGNLNSRLQEKISQFKKFHPTNQHAAGDLNERDAVLITYADQVTEREKPPLQSLTEFCRKYLYGIIPGIHILPFFPFSSDDGFSIINYRRVDEKLGSWQDIASLTENFYLMFDAVINHVSAQNPWFIGYLQGEAKYRDYFIEVKSECDLSHVVRPRALPLLTEFETSLGTKKIWTTFSADQIDLNYHNPEVLLEILDTILFYVSKGVRFIRLDAIAYLWKEIGTTCIHLPQTHWIVQIIRAMLDSAAPQVKIITETNVAHMENISYFGDGENESHLVYNFALPPLVLHSLLTGNAEKLSQWADQITLPAKNVTFFNFLASHDGIGLNPVRGILDHNDLDALVERAIVSGGEVSYKHNPDGTQSPYELNINYFDALNNQRQVMPLELQVEKFITAHAIMLALRGVPGIYFHSMFGSRSWAEGIKQSGMKRAINRQKFDRCALEQELLDHHSIRWRTYSRLGLLFKTRHLYEEFSPYSEQKVLFLHPAVFSIIRFLENGRRRILCLHNVSNRYQEAVIDIPPYQKKPFSGIREIISRQLLVLNKRSAVSLKPYQTKWLLLDG